ncbi:membrane-bound lytic murein transglycosylase B [Gammaproteobacteria bacterium]|nr:membrane-bound lytic murein transglycosylase B [Gammaproteobacteria bacterium]
MLLNKAIITVCLSGLLFGCQASTSQNTSKVAPPPVEIVTGDAHLEQRLDVQSFIKMMVTKHGFNEKYLQDIFTKTRSQPKIIAAISRPAEKSKTWGEYRPIFMTQKRIADGVLFYKNNEADLKRAEQQYGVNAETIVAIIGVETSYGANKGNWRVIDALSTLAFNYPKRADFFVKELEHFLIIVRENSADPFSYTGSYAGAMGLPQFMPSSYRNFAVDFNGDHKRDLWNNKSDAIGSVANYLAKNGWSRGGSIALQVKASPNASIAKVTHDGSIKAPYNSVAELIKAGVVTTANPNGKALLLKFENTSGLEYWFGFQNFYSITRYNRSPLYALAVYQLGQAIKQAL